MIDLYTWSTPNGRKVSILLEELGAPYNVHPIDISTGIQKGPDFVAISPNGRIPAIVDQDTGRSMMESGAILLYLAEKHGAFLGPDRWRTIEWLMWQMGGIGPMIGQAHHFLHGDPGHSEYGEKRYWTETARLYGVLEARLAARDFVADDYSIADMAIWPWISRFQRHRISLSDYPNVKDWYLRIAERPAVQRGYAVPAPEEVPLP